MKAYLLKPNRLFTSKPQDTIGGGAIQGEDLGSRMGFAKPIPANTLKKNMRRLKKSQIFLYQIKLLQNI